MILFGGRLKLLRAGDAGEVTGAIDARSKSLFAKSTVSMVVIPWAPSVMTFTGTSELSASAQGPGPDLVGDGRLWNERLPSNLLGFLELWGGMRVVPLQGAAVRAGGRAEGKVEFIGTGGGFSLAIDVQARFGWNPCALEGIVKVSGDAWLQVLGVRRGVGISTTLAAQLPEPLDLRLECRVPA